MPLSSLFKWLKTSERIPTTQEKQFPKLYRVLYHDEYSKPVGKFGIVEVQFTGSEYILEDGFSFPENELSNASYLWKGSYQKSMSDYQMTVFPWRLISDKMYHVLKDFSPVSEVVYHPVKVYSEEYGWFNYYLMHFLVKHDVLDKQRTGTSLLNPVADPVKARNLDVFVYEEFDPSVFCISERVRLALQQAGINGCAFQGIS